MCKIKIETIYSDNQIIVINKPAGVSITKDRAGNKNLLEILCLENTDLRIVHRLDKPTSGVMMFAKGTDCQRQYSKLFESRDVEKIYLALVMGYCGQSGGIIDAPIAKDRKEPAKMRIDKKGKPSTTEWKLIADFGMVSLVAAKPLTGRTHQIRVHLASIGLPLAIDEFYGGNRPLMLSEFKRDYRLGKFAEEKPLIDSLTLHSYQLRFSHFDNAFVAKCQSKFAAAVKMLAKHKAANLDDNSKNIINDILDGKEIKF